VRSTAASRGTPCVTGRPLDALRRHVGKESADLVYLDPPFKSNQDYNLLFAEHGTQSAAQITAFEATWRWDEVAATAYEETVEGAVTRAQALVAFRTSSISSGCSGFLAIPKSSFGPLLGPSD
jgi:16S rRNA G966 N2-methylase RsmD